MITHKRLKNIPKMRSATLLISEIVKNRELLCYDDSLPLVDSGGGGSMIGDGLMPSLVSPVYCRQENHEQKKNVSSIFRLSLFFSGPAIGIFFLSRSFFPS